ncbi:glycosyltransferase [Halomonas sp.]|uniref:glycosyltransferase n=1 Tax=Halomonas sp. TaxID=1486246 RepID=UPI00298DA0BE|nr:glycosyltransferase [Halomonas sp.]MDW7746925.1 glycosyltransferase [Halomonas sp.]
MNIMHIVSSAASGGAEIYVKDLSKEMVARGNNVFIVFLDRAVESGRDAIFEASFLDELDKSGIEYGFLGSSSRKNPVKGALGLARLCRKFSPDVIHSHLYFGALFSLFQFRIPHVYTHHNIKLKASPYFYRLLDLRTTAYVGICIACEALLKGVTRKQVVRIDNGVDESRVIPKNTCSPGVPLKLICVSTLSLQKNHQLLLHAISKLPDLDLLLTVAGEGSQAHHLKGLVRELGIERKVNFIGNSNNIKQLLHDSDLFVMSSAWEGLPIVQIEATLTGLPVLVTDVGGCSEIVSRVGNGLVAKVELEDYTEKLKRLIVDGELRSIFHNNALKNRGYYTIDNAVNSHLKLYVNLTRQLARHA